MILILLVRISSSGRRERIGSYQDVGSFEILFGEIKRIDIIE